MSELLWDLRWFLWKKWVLVFFRRFPKLCNHKSGGRIWMVGTIDAFGGDRVYSGSSEVCDRCLCPIWEKGYAYVAGQKVPMKVKGDSSGPSV